jgi:hypothetical protein
MTGHLIHIGYAKAGSTYLQRWFEAHPGLAYSTRGLGGYRSVYAIAAEAAGGRLDGRWRVTSCEDLSAPQADVGQLVIDYEEAMRGSWANRQDAARPLLAGLFPDAHILIVTRGFRSMILSSYSQYVRSGGSEDFESLTAGTRDNHPWDYDRLIEGYRAVFGAERVIVLPFELLRDDPASFTATLESRLGLAPFPPKGDRANPSLSPLELRWYPKLSRRLERLPVGLATRRRLQARYFAAVDKGRLAWLARLLQRLRPAPPFASGLVDDDFLEGMRGCGEGLARVPLYRPYAADYLFDAGRQA